MFEAATKITGSHADRGTLAGEDAIVRKALRTDLVLSAEIMVIALAEVVDDPLAVQAVALAIVAVVMTVGVYGVVACVVRGDDVGAHLASSARPSLALIGRLLIKFTLLVLRLLAIVGVAAMCWVGGHIFLEQLAAFSLSAPYEALYNLVRSLVSAPFLVWLLETVAYALVGLAGAACFAPLVRRRAHP
jgi:predicted DNA repair protein MutK